MRNRAGFTLIEVLVSMAVGLFVLAAAITLTTDQGRVLGRTTSRLDMYQTARLATSILAQDIRHAGVGLGYRPDGRFPGLARGTFTVPGGASFQANDRPISLASGDLVTDDLSVRQAVGTVRTIASFSGSSGEICRGSDFAAGDVVVMMTREGLHARTVRLGGLNSSACTQGVCVGGCDSFSFTADSSYVSDPAALTASYTEGEMAGEYREVVWFVTPDATGEGRLQRAEVTAQAPCGAADDTCGGTVATNVESLQIGVWQWDALTSQWVDRTGAADIDDRSRIRVDVELVVKGPRADERLPPQNPVALELAPGHCAPAPCGSQDRVPRHVMRSSVEIRNSGRMQIR